MSEQHDQRLEREEVEEVREASQAAGTGAERLDRPMHPSAAVHGQVTERVGVETRMRGLLMVFLVVPAPPVLGSDPVMQEANPTEEALQRPAADDRTVKQLVTNEAQTRVGVADDQRREEHERPVRVEHDYRPPARRDDHQMNR